MSLIGIEWEPQLVFPELGEIPIYVQHTSGITNVTKVIAESRRETYGRGLSPGNKIEEYGMLSINLNDFNIDSSKLNLDIASSWIDYTNIEVRTSPVRPNALQDEIEKATKHLGRFIGQLSKQLSMKIGVFLPVSRKESNTKLNVHFNRSKHINISFADAFVLSAASHSHVCTLRNFPNENKFDYYLTDLKIKSGEKQTRLHFTTPYSFTKYQEFFSVAREYVNTDVKKVYNFLDKPFNPKPHLVGCTDLKGKWKEIGGLI
jgi:hypothetical protein